MADIPACGPFGRRCFRPPLLIVAVPAALAAAAFALAAVPGALIAAIIGVPLG